MSASYPKVLYAGLQASYDAIQNKDASILYFCTDTGKLYKGSVDFTESCRVVATAPVAPAEGILYIVTGTGKAQFFDGENWQTVSLPTVTEFTDATADDNHVATTEAIVEYVASVIGGSSDVVKTIVAGDDAGEITYTTADGDDHDVVVPGVGTTLAAGTSAAQVKLEHTTGTDDTVVVPGVVTGLAADTTAATVNVTTSTGTHADVVVPGVVTGLAATQGVGNEGKISVTLSSGTHADVVVPKVFKDASWNSNSRILSFTDTNGNTKTVDLGKDIFIDQNANNRYESGNIYLYLNDGSTIAEDTEIVIPVTGLITDYFGDDTDSISVDINSTTHKVTASLIVKPNSTTPGSEFTNALQVDSTGAYVDLSDVEDSIDALADAITWGSF